MKKVLNFLISPFNLAFLCSFLLSIVFMVVGFLITGLVANATSSPVFSLILGGITFAVGAFIVTLTFISISLRTIQNKMDGTNNKLSFADIRRYAKPTLIYFIFSVLFRFLVQAVMVGLAMLLGSNQVAFLIVVCVVYILVCFWTMAATYYFLLTLDGFAPFRFPTVFDFLKKHFLRILVVLLACIGIGIAGVACLTLFYDEQHLTNIATRPDSISLVGIIITAVLCLYFAYLMWIINGLIACWVGHDYIENNK